MSRLHSYSAVGATIVVLAIFTSRPIRGAGVSLTGTVKAGGQSTSADAVVYVDQVAGEATPPNPGRRRPLSRHDR